MPIERDASGHSIYTPLRTIVTAHPSDFFRDKPEEYVRRTERAQKKVCDAIRFAERPLSGLGTCHEFAINPMSSKSAVGQLADFANTYDDRRAKKVRAQRHREATVGLAPHEHRLRSPQNLFRRRSILFGGRDIPVDFFNRKVHVSEIDQFVQQMRWTLIEEAIEEMYASGKLELVGDIWSVRVSDMDAHRLSTQRSNRVKRDDRSWHGRPNRDRSRVKVAP